jgi:phosphoglycolate phosphatase-like HAD superfamily hydrolase
MSYLRCLVFDCDGVLLDSVPIKTMALARLAAPYGDEARDRLVMYHALHGGVSRYLKFAWFFREVLGREITRDESRDWGERFAEYALEELRRCPLIPGVQTVLDSWSGRLPMYVCSGAPAQELGQLLQERDIARYFAGIYGSPPAKAGLLAQIVDASGVAAEETLMVGDATTDRDAAEEVGTRFYGIGDLLRGGDFPWGSDLRDLDGWIRERVAPAAEMSASPA